MNEKNYGTNDRGVCFEHNARILGLGGREGCQNNWCPARDLKQEPRTTSADSATAMCIAQKE